MASKPSNVPRWANSGGEVTEPNEGKKDVGAVAGKSLPAQYFNWLLYTIYLWIVYLKDGALSGAHSIAGKLTTEDVEPDGDGTRDIGASGAQYRDAYLSRHLRTDELHVRNNADNDEGDVKAKKVSAATVATVRRIPALAGKQTDGASEGSFVGNGGFYENADTDDVFIVPIETSPGETISAIRARVQDISDINDGIITMEVYRVDDSGSSSLGSASSDGSGNNQTLSVASLAETVPSDGSTYYTAKFTFAEKPTMSVFSVQVESA